MRFVAFLPFLLLLLASLLAAPAPADGETLSARLLDVDVSYGQEAWKYSTAYEGPGSPAQQVGHIQNRTSTYYGAVGLRATFKVQLFDVQEPSRDVRDSAYNLTAYIPTVRGSLYAYVGRGPGTLPGPSNSDIFYLEFDLDGANNGDPAGRLPPAAEPGLRGIHVDITKRQNDVPPTRSVGSADLTFTYEIPASAVTVPAFQGLPYLETVPDGIFRLYNDIGWGRSVLLIHRSVNQSQAVNVDYQFGGPGRLVRLFGLLAERAVALPAPAGNQTTPLPTAPFIPGVSDNQTLQNALGQTDSLVVVHREELGSGTTDATGLVRFTVTGQQLLGVSDDAVRSGLFVLAPVLDPQMPAEPNPLNHAGGAHIRVGATELAVPVSDNRARMEAYRLIDPNVNANSLPDPIRSYGLSVNALQVDVRDLDGFLNQNPPQSRTGDLFAISPSVRNERALSGTSLSPTQSDPQNLRGNLAVRPIQEQGVSEYRLLAFLYRENDQFYTLTYGDRGYRIDVSANAVPIGTAGTLLVNLTSRNTDYDLLAGEQDFDLKVFVRVDAKDFNFNRTKDYLLKEAGFLGLQFPFTSNKTGEVRIVVSSTSGDATPRDARATMTFYEPPPKKGFADRLPGFEGPLALAAVLLIVGFAWRRRAR